jgi:uncharacterized integral membrane protein
LNEETMTVTHTETSPLEEPAAEVPVADPGLLSPPESESNRARLARHTRRARLYASAGVFVALFVVLVLLASANTKMAKLDWIVGSTHASLSWIVLATAVFGWLLGITTALTVQHRTRRPR